MIHAKPHAPAYERAPVHLTRLQVLILFLSPLALIFLIAFAFSFTALGRAENYLSQEPADETTMKG